MRGSAHWIAILVMALGTGTAAHARLGESEASVEIDRSAMHGKPVLKTVKSGYAIHETRNSARSLRQFVAKKNGLVFGLAWKGVSPPVELDRLTGRYYSEYASAFRKRAQAVKGPLRVRALRLETEHLLIDRGGQGRALAGRIFVKHLMPTGAGLDEIE